MAIGIGWRRFPAAVAAGVFAAAACASLAACGICGTPGAAP
jgi:hypothetical protein